MRIRFRYTSYPDSKLATNFDRLCHSPQRVFLWMAGLLYCVYWMICSEYISPDVRDTVYDIFFVVFIVWSLIMPFTGLLCDKLKLSQKLALWDMKRKANSGKLDRKFWIAFVIVLLALLLPVTAAVICKTVNDNQAQAYHETMQVLDAPEQVDVTGSKVVTFQTNTSRYTTKYIPDSLLAQAPEEARYILRCTAGAELYGFYEASSVSGYRRICELELIDRTTGDVVAAETIAGSNPPHSIESGTKNDQYGGYPDEEEIAAWLSDILSN